MGNGVHGGGDGDGAGGVSRVGFRRIWNGAGASIFLTIGGCELPLSSNAGM